MQPYERIGLVALMFLVVLLAVGFLWDDGSGSDAVLAAERPVVERVDEEAAARAAAAQEQHERVQATRAGMAKAEASGRGAGRTLRMGGQDEQGKRVNRVTTASAGSDHRSDPLDSAEGLASPAKAQSADELASFARPNTGRTRLAADQNARPGAGRGNGETVSMNQRSPRRRTADESSSDRSVRSQPTAEFTAGSTAGSTKAKVAKAKAAPAKKAASKAATYTVRPGDVLQRIALRELGDSSRTDEIASLNGLSNPDMIRIGMVLTLPAKVSGSGTSSNVASSSVPAPAQVASAAGSSAVGKNYTVKSGESLSRALTRELGTYKRSIKLVQALNPGLNPDRVYAGQVIKLPRLEDIPAGSKGKAARKASSNNGAPTLTTAPRSSKVASAERSAPARSQSTRSNDEFVVR